MFSYQKHNKALLFLVICFSFAANHAYSQSWSITGNANIAPGTQYLGTKDPNDLVFRTNAIERGRVFGAGGDWRFGSATNFAKIDSLGRLTFAGQGRYLVGASKYVFQYAANPNYGLFFNATPLQYEFRNSAATSVFTVNATTGAGAFTGTLKIGAYILPATDGTNGQVLKTNGSGAVNWGNTGGWSTTGNGGTSLATNFIGTTDATGFAVRTSNTERLRITSGGNIGIGTTTPGARFTVAVENGVSLSTTDSFLLGKKTGINMAFDYNEIQARNNGAGSPLFLNQWGGATWIGSHNGSAVPAVYAEQDGRVGIGNTAVSTGYALTVNPSLAGSGINIADPVDNISLYTSVSGKGQAIVVYNTNPSSTAATIYSSNAGTGAGINGYSENYAGVLGQSQGNIGGYFTSVNSSALYAYDADNASNYAGFFVGDVYSSGVYLGSDQKLKQNIKDLRTAMSIINLLKPKQYDFRHDGDFSRMNLPGGNHFGLIAQDVEKVLPNLVKTSKFDVPSVAKDGTAPNQKDKQAESMDLKAVNYTELIPIMIKGMQEQEQTINRQQEAISKQQETIGKQQQQIDDLKVLVLNLTRGTVSLSAAGSSAITNRTTLSSAALEQNIPNPLTNTTGIRYYIPAGSINSLLSVKDMNGKAIRQIALQAGAGTVTIDASTVSAGAYSYTLIIDGKTIATKKMMIAR